MKTARIEKIENRSFELRSFEQINGDSGSHEAVGYASVFNSPTIIGDSFQESIAPGAFAQSLANEDVRALFNHDWANVLGRVKSGTLSLEENERGLKFSVKLPDTSTARDLAVLMERGDINQCSFGFVPLEEDWNWDNPDLPVRTINKVKLYEVSIVSLPAYEDTEVSLSRDKFGDARNIDLRKQIIKTLEDLKHE